MVAIRSKLHVSIGGLDGVGLQTMPTLNKSGLSAEDRLTSQTMTLFTTVANILDRRID